MMWRVLGGLVGWLVSVSGAFALDAEAGTPYDYRVILRVAPNRLLTPTFRGQLRDDLRDSLQAALGPLARVEVLDADAPQSGAWLDPASLDTHSALHEAKRHFVEVSYAHGQYTIQARQLDGSTGLASPVIRQDRTADRAFVARLIVRFIDQDFGAVGTVVGKDGDRVRLRLRGGAVPGADLSHWVPAGSVFALARVAGDPPRGWPVEAALLRTLGEPKGGEVECQFFYRYRDARQRDPLADWQAVGFRALRLGTTSAPVRLRVVDTDGLPVNDLRVHVGPTGFNPKEFRDEGTVRHDGFFETTHPYEHVAFVRIDSSPPAQVPVAVLDDRVIVCKVTPGANGEARQMAAIEVRNLRQTLSDHVRRLVELRRQLGTMIKATQNKEALAQVQSGLELLDTQLGNLSEALFRLKGEAQRVGAGLGPELEQCELYLKRIHELQQSFRQTQSDLERAVKAEDDPANREKQEGYLALLSKAQALRDEAEFDKAIATYKEILQKFGPRDEVRKRLEALEKAWQIQSEEHRRARTFAYGAWAAVRTVDDIHAQLPKARKAFDACRAAGDKLTALKLFLVATNTATEIVSRRSDELGNSQSDEDKVNLRQVQKVSEDLQALIKDVSAFLREGENEK
jgi:tetratricopeptide (TPR) repeat protein